MTHPTDVDVLIVGAGPTGLTLACLLAQFGVKFRIIEKNSKISEQSKAIAIQARTLELFEQLDLSEKAIALGFPVEGIHLVSQGKTRATFDLREYGKGLTKYPFILILEQNKTEKLLLDKLESLGKKVEWRQELVDMAQHPDSVTVSITGGSKIETLRAKYLVAADGAHSAVRTILRLAYEGNSYESRFVLADVKIDGPVSRNHISLCLSKNGYTSLFPMPGEGRFRTISAWPASLGESPEKDSSFIADEILKQAQLPLKISEMWWLSTYKTYHRSILHFKEQRCFFAGDSAHLHSPAGGQGMNTGVQDAFNLAWKTAYVLSGRARDKLLETYHEERFPVARKLIHTSDRVFTIATDSRPLFRWIRLVLAPLLLRIAANFSYVRSAVFKVISQLGVNYHESSLNYQGFPTEGPLRAGDRFLFSGGQDMKFRAFMVGAPDAQEQAKRLLEKFFDEGIVFHTLDKRPDLHSILQSFGITKDGLVLVRPDGYVCYCVENLDISLLFKYLNSFFLEKNAPQEIHPDNKEAFPFESFI